MAPSNRSGQCGKRPQRKSRCRSVPHARKNDQFWLAGKAFEGSQWKKEFQVLVDMFIKRLPELLEVNALFPASFHRGLGFGFTITDSSDSYGRYMYTINTVTDNYTHNWVKGKPLLAITPTCLLWEQQSNWKRDKARKSLKGGINLLSHRELFKSCITAAAVSLGPVLNNDLCVGCVEQGVGQT